MYNLQKPKQPERNELKKTRQHEKNKNNLKQPDDHETTYTNSS